MKVANARLCDIITEKEGSKGYKPRRPKGWVERDQTQWDGNVMLQVKEKVMRWS